jgi:hypothetical protein
MPCELELWELYTSSREHSLQTCLYLPNMDYGCVASKTLWIGRYVPMVPDLFPHLREKRYWYTFAQYTFSQTRRHGTIKSLATELAMPEPSVLLL